VSRNEYALRRRPNATRDTSSAPNLAFENAQQRPHIQGSGLHRRSSILGSIDNPVKGGDGFETFVQDFSPSANGRFGNDPVGLASDQTVINGSGQGKSIRGTERAKLACVACRRDNKKARLYDP
jgi:hypothetical protein